MAKITRIRTAEHRRLSEQVSQLRDERRKRIKEKLPSASSVPVLRALVYDMAIELGIIEDTE